MQALNNGKTLVVKSNEENYLAQQNEFEKVDSIYRCEGKFKFIELYDDEEDDW